MLPGSRIQEVIPPGQEQVLAGSSSMSCPNIDVPDVMDITPRTNKTHEQGTALKDEIRDFLHSLSTRVDVNEWGK